MKKIFLILLFLLFVSPSFAMDSEKINLYYNNGVNYFKEKKYSSAIGEFQKVLRQRPYDATVKNALAMSYLARAQYYKDTEHAYKKAINDYRSALVYLKYWDGEPDESKAIMADKAKSNLDYLKRMYAPTKTPLASVQEGDTLRSQGEFAAAIYEYIQAYTDSKSRAQAYSKASDIYKNLNNQKKAIDSIRNAISSDNKNGMYHFKYALILDDIQNEDAAMDEYSKALEYSDNNVALLDALKELWLARSVKNPNDSQSLINLGAILQKQKQYDLAIAQYVKARQINPNDPVILINLASAYADKGDIAGAIRIYDEITLKNPSDLSARFYKGKLYERQGDINSAIKQYKEILSLKKDDERARNSLNALLSGLNGEQLGGYLLAEADANPNSYDAQFKCAYEMHKNKKYAPAIEYYKKAIAIDPRHSEPFINLAQIFILQKDFTRAKNVIAHGLSVLPDEAELVKLRSELDKNAANDLYAKGIELYNAKNYTEALNYFLKITYQTPQINTMIANCYYELREGDKAIEYYNKVLAQNPNDENSLYMVANLLIASKREDTAKDYLNKILKINPNNQDAKNTLLALNEGQEGEMLESAIKSYEAKNYDEALNTLNSLIAKNPKNPYAYYYSGLIYEEKNNPDMAISQYLKSISSDANFSLSYYMAAVLYDTKEDYKTALGYYDKYIALKKKEGVDDEYSKYAQSRVKELRDYLSQK